MSECEVQLDNENNVTELTIAPDGRVFVFGTSRPALEVLHALRPDDRRVRALLDAAARAKRPDHVNALVAEGVSP